MINPTHLAHSTHLTNLANIAVSALKPLTLAVLMSVSMMSAQAGTFIAHTDYLDYQLPESISKICADKQSCPEIKIEYLKSNQDWVNTIVNDRINALIWSSTDVGETVSKVPKGKNMNAKAIKAKLDGFAQAQIKELPADRQLNYSLDITPIYLGHAGDVEQVEITSYVFLGGAHGMPYTEYVMLDGSSKRRLHLDDLLMANKKPKFKALAYEAYKAWVKQMGNDNLKDYEKSWPFSLTDNAMLTDKGVVLKYQAYDIGPYAFGQPELLVPYAKLSGVIKPQYISK